MEVSQSLSPTTPPPTLLIGTRNVIISIIKNDSDDSDDDIIATTAASNNKRQKEGVMAVYQSIQNNNDNDEPSSLLQVQVCNGEAVVLGQIDASTIRSLSSFNNNDKNKSSILADMLLKVDNPNITLVFSQSLSNSSKNSRSRTASSTIMTMKIKQRMSNGLEKFIHQGQLMQQQKISVVAFIQQIGEATNQFLLESKLAKSELATANSYIEEWKQTCNNLDWQSHKDELLQNFVTLLNKTKKEAREEIQNLQQELQQIKSSRAATSKQSFLTSLFEQNDNEDPISMQEVQDILSSSKSNNKRKQQEEQPNKVPSILSPSTMITSTQLKAQATNYQKEQTKKRRMKNDSTTAITTAPRNVAKKTRVVVKRTKDDTDEDSDNDNAAAASSKRGSNNSNNKNKSQIKTQSYNDTLVDSDDEALRNLIRAQINKNK